MTRVSRKMGFVLGILLLMLCIVPKSTVYAQNLDNIGTTQSEGNDSDGAVSDYLKGYNPVTDDNMKQAGTYASPLVSMIGVVSGFIVMIVSALIFLVTALDLAYIGVPFLRPYLNPNYGSGGGQSAGGMGMGGGMYGGSMGGMGASQGGQASGGKVFVSDEAIACVSMASSGGQQGGMSGGMYGGSMGSMGASQGGQQQPTKSVIFTYLKKRIFFLIIFYIC